MSGRPAGRWASTHSACASGSDWPTGCSEGPEVLILDEPANGLDPEGMRWMRRLLRDFADRGGPVLLSSHLLAEGEAVADRMIIIAHGRIRAQGTRAELLPRTGTIAEADDVVLRRIAPPEETELERLFFELTASAADAASPRTDRERRG